jgi:glyoxylate utilization-related uncharacterized protein
MAIAITTEATPTCPSDSGLTVPFAALEMIEAPDSGTGAMRGQSHTTTVVQAVEGVVYVVAGDHDWVLTAGDSATIPAGMPYRSWNAGEQQARWVELFCG